MNKVISMIAKISIPSFLVLGLSFNVFANTSEISAPAKVVNRNAFNHILATPVQKDEFKYISQKLNESNLPVALAAIPMIESHYNNKAVSGKGAGGLWQLMPATAKQFGITSRARFQLEPSTGAALNYFKTLYQKFGNWEFAIAAYNAGDGRVLKALQHNPSATSVQQLKLPKETKQYVQKFYQTQSELKAYTA